MKSLLRVPIAALFAFLSRLILRKYKPRIVMVTGSVGKTSTKDAVAAALTPHFHLRASEKSYNSEFGVPLTIIGAKNPWENPSAWIRVLGEALALIFLPSHYPKLLVLEVGADRPGDLAHILEIATPDAVVVTKLPDVPVHVEAYASPAAVREEEFAPALALAPGAPLIVSEDDGYARELAKRLSAHIVSYGFSADAKVRISRPEVLIEAGVPVGMEAHVNVFGTKTNLVVRGALGRPQLYAPAAALALATALGLTFEEALQNLASYVPPPGRLRLLRGKGESIVLDDTYNASPTAAIEALDALTLVPNAKRRIAILGDMLELGRFSREQHEAIGRYAAERAHIVIGVGVRTAALVDAAAHAGGASLETKHFDDVQQAVGGLGDFARAGDVILLKGSQGVRMEHLVATFLEDSADRSLLVRQEREWLKRG